MPSQEELKKLSVYQLNDKEHQQWEMFRLAKQDGDDKAAAEYVALAHLYRDELRKRTIVE